MQSTRVVELPTKKAALVLAYLILHGGRQARSKIAALFWGNDSERRAQYSLRSALSFLRRALGPDILLADREVIQLNPLVPLWVDVRAFEQMALQFANHPDPNLLACESGLYRGDLLADFYEDWIIPLRGHYQQMLIQLLLRGVELLRGEALHQQALECARRVLSVDCFNEAAVQQIMYCHYALGERNEALLAYLACQHILQEELGVQPTDETLALYSWIKQQG